MQAKWDGEHFGGNWCTFYRKLCPKELLIDAGFTNLYTVGTSMRMFSELAVINVVKREPFTYGKENKVLPSSGGTYYHFNSGTSVKHTVAGTWVCLKSSCKAYYDDDDPIKGKGCEHTRCAMRYAETHDHIYGP